MCRVGQSHRVPPHTVLLPHMSYERGGAVDFVVRSGGVLEALESIFDVFWHREMYLLARVIPLDGESTVSFPFVFDQALVIFLDRLQEVLGVLLTDVFDAKVVNDQR